MAKQPKPGYSIRKPRKSKHYCCRIWIADQKRYKEISCKTDDAAIAAQRAAEIYATWVSEHEQHAKLVVPKSNTNIERLGVKWIQSLQGILADVSLITYTCRVDRLGGHFGDLSKVTPTTCKTYWQSRLQEVQRQSLVADISCLTQLSRWAVESGYLHKMPIIPSVPAKLVGTIYAKRRRVKPDPISDEEARSIINALPEFAKGTGAIRSRFVVAYELALRPATLDKLKVPDHWQPNQTFIDINPGAMKQRKASIKPLTPKAYAALLQAHSLMIEGQTLLWGAHRYDHYIHAAALAVLKDDRGKRFAPCHFRSASISEFLAQGASLPAAMQLADHTKASTTNKYVRSRTTQLEDELRRTGRLLQGEPTLVDKK